MDDPALFMPHLEFTQNLGLTRGCLAGAPGSENGATLPPFAACSREKREGRCGFRASSANRSSRAALFPRHPAGRTAGSARTRSRVQGRLSSKCNCLEEDIERRAPAKTLARPAVDQIKDALKLRLWYVQKVTTTRKEISKQSVGVFVAAPLPRLMRFRKVHWRFELLLQFSKLRKF